MTMAAENRLTQIEARLNAATPGEWAWHPYMGDGSMTLASPNPPLHESNVLKTTIDWPPTSADAALIAHAPADLRYLLARLREAEGRQKATWFTAQNRAQWIFRLQGEKGELRERAEKAERELFACKAYAAELQDALDRVETKNGEATDD